MHFDTTLDIREATYRNDVSLKKIIPRHLHTHVYCSAIHNSQVMETTNIPHYWWMDRENVILIYKGILLSHEEEWNLIICK
jgi:hypothetical protein